MVNSLQLCMAEHVPLVFRGSRNWIPHSAPASVFAGAFSAERSLCLLHLIRGEQLNVLWAADATHVKYGHLASLASSSRLEIRAMIAGVCFGFLGEALIFAMTSRNTCGVIPCVIRVFTLSARFFDHFHSPALTAAHITLMKKAAMIRTDATRSQVGTCGKSLVCSCVISRQIYRQDTGSVVARRQVCDCSRARSGAMVFAAIVIIDGCVATADSTQKVRLSLRLACRNSALFCFGCRGHRRGSAFLVRVEDVVLCLHGRMARVTAV
jgi:hypothetical protein